MSDHASRSGAGRAGARPRTVLVVGGFGDLGAAISAELRTEGAHVLRASREDRSADPDAVQIVEDADLGALPALDAVVWAHGVNVNDGVESFLSEDLDRVLHVNVALVARQLKVLVGEKKLGRGSRVVVLSSIWENIARPGKFSYAVSKAAVGGLVRAAAMDLAPRGILVNGVLPGVVDTAMTRRMLAAAQIDDVTRSTGSGRMVQPADVASLVSYLASERNTGVTGQSIVVDLGFTVGRVI